MFHNAPLTEIAVLPRCEVYPRPPAIKELSHILVAVSDVFNHVVGILQIDVWPKKSETISADHVVPNGDTCLAIACHL
jgi:hypothetical protein